MGLPLGGWCLRVVIFAIRTAVPSPFVTGELFMVLMISGSGDSWRVRTTNGRAGV
jgi:hypothetical protein